MRAQECLRDDDVSRLTLSACNGCSSNLPFCFVMVFRFRISAILCFVMVFRIRMSAMVFRIRMSAILCFVMVFGSEIQNHVFKIVIGPQLKEPFVL